mmetsp:Transcript_3258/g.5413  ORF Transcript_3258/g.5413 Transcript_3258/m.5413 type:complete len:89 (+) Transcript_3258:57-323(+)
MLDKENQKMLEERSRRFPFSGGVSILISDQNADTSQVFNDGMEKNLNEFEIPNGQTLDNGQQNRTIDSRSKRVPLMAIPAQTPIPTIN